MLMATDSKSRFGVVLVASALLAACTPTEDTAGQVVDITDHMVVINGAFDMNIANAGPAKPTAAMIAQAQAICPGAQYLTAEPSNRSEYDWTFNYKFRCPTGPARG